MQDPIQWVLRICAIEPLITIAAANDQIRCLKLGHLILNRSQCERKIHLAPELHLLVGQAARVGEDGQRITG